MKMNRNRTIFDFLLILSGALFTLFFLHLSKPYWVTDPGRFIKLTLSFFIASFVFGALGMILEARSRVGGILLLAVSLQFVYAFSQNGFLRFDGTFLGLTESGYLTYYSVVNNRFDKLALYMRRSIKTFFALTFLYILSQILYNNTINETLELIVLIGTYCVVYSLLMKTVYGIKAFDVFIYGPSQSGKTLMILTLYTHFIYLLNGQIKEFIWSDTNEERLKIENMLADIENGMLPKSNLRTDLAVYMLSGKKNFRPIRMTFVDYGGEHINDFKPLQFKNVIAELNTCFNIKEPHELEQNIGNIDFIKNLRDSHKGNFAASIDKITFAHIYKKFEGAGKIIFLVDGNHIVSYSNGGKNELMKLFGHYSRIIKLFGDKKSYAIVVTKTDQFSDLSTILETSEEAKEIERNIYEIFCKISTFKEITNMASKVPIYMYAISIDATMKPFNLKEDERDILTKYLKINPWEVVEIEKFIF